MFNSTGGINKMKNIKYFFIGLSAIFLFTFQSYAQDVEKVKEQIEEEQTSFMESFNNGDAKAAAEYYTADAIVLPPNTPEVKGKEAIVNLWQSFIGMDASVKLNTVNTVVFRKTCRGLSNISV